MLRGRLTRRGVAPAVTLLDAVLDPTSSQLTCPEPLVSFSLRSATRLAAGGLLAETVSARVLELVTGASRSMMLTNLRKACALAVPLLATASVVALASSPGSLPSVVPFSARNGQAAVLAPLELALLPNEENPEQGGEDAFKDFPASVVKTVPSTGSTDVDPALSEIRATFSKEMMDGTWSWSTVSKESFPETSGKPSYANDKRTAVLPVKLEPGKTYALFLNSPRFGNFKDVEGHSAVPYLLMFRTRK
jgi:RNA polymerase sigma-70 factor (ECF subfamily)